MKWYEKQKHMFEQTMNEENPSPTHAHAHAHAHVEEEPEALEQEVEYVEAPNPYVQEVVEEPVRNYVPEVPQSDVPQTYIAEQTLIVGDVESDCDLFVYGHIKGNVSCINGTVTVCGEVEGKINCENAVFENAIVRDDVLCNGSLQLDSSSAVNGNIAAREVYINGKIKGDIKVEDIIHLGSASVVIGSISAADIEIERGSIIQGGLMIRQEYSSEN